METQLNSYEGMFLLDPWGGEWDRVRGQIELMLQKEGAEILICKKWDERRLAYEIKGRKRAGYVLTYFKAPPTIQSAIERQVQLSDNILRCLILRADYVTEEKMKEPTPAEGGGKPKEHASHDRDDRPARRTPRSPAPKPIEAAAPEKTESEAPNKADASSESQRED